MLITSFLIIELKLERANWHSAVFQCFPFKQSQFFFSRLEFDLRIFFEHTHFFFLKPTLFQMKEKSYSSFKFSFSFSFIKMYSFHYHENASNSVSNYLILSRAKSLHYLAVQNNMVSFSNELCACVNLSTAIKIQMQFCVFTSSSYVRMSRKVGNEVTNN